MLVTTSPFDKIIHIKMLTKQNDYCTGLHTSDVSQTPFKNNHLNSYIAGIKLGEERPFKNVWLLKTV